jgi:haloalkane dehalogenase
MLSAFPSGSRSQTVAVEGSFMHYVEVGVGEPIVFLHGNPTSAYLWRNVIPYLMGSGRCIAIDCIGMGQSGKPDIAYRLVDHMNYIDAVIDALGLTNITFVAHDWGVVLALGFARRHAGRVKAIALMEGHIHPIERWSDFDEASQSMFKQLRTETRGRQMVVDEHFFVETILPAGTQRALSEAEMDAYRAPYRDRQARIPLWRWANEIPIEGHPPDVHAAVAANQAYLATADLPKLLFYAQPGAVIRAADVLWCQQTCRNLKAVDLGPGIHFLPEDHPAAIGTAIADWLNGL